MKQNTFVAIGNTPDVVSKLETIVHRAGGVVVSHDLKNIPKGAQVITAVHDDDSFVEAEEMKTDRDPALGLVIVILDFAYVTLVRYTKTTVPHTRILGGGAPDTSLEEFAEVLSVPWRCNAA